MISQPAGRTWHAEVLTHEHRSSGVAVFTCRPVHPLAYQAGQHVRIECPYRPWRSRAYSIANAPRPDGMLEFHVRDAGTAGVSSALVHRLKPGDVLRLGPPSGAMMLDRYSRRDVVFVTGGIGLAPAKALIEELRWYNRTRWIHLFRGERHRDDFYDRTQLDRLADRYPWLTIVRATSDEPDENGEQAVISDVVARHGPWPHHDFYVSGSEQMVRATLLVLQRAGVPMAHIRYDVFSVEQAGPRPVARP